MELPRLVLLLLLSNGMLCCVLLSVCSRTSSLIDQKGIIRKHNFIWRAHSFPLGKDHARYQACRLLASASAAAGEACANDEAESAT